MATYLADNYYGAQQRVSVVSGVGGVVGGARGRGAPAAIPAAYSYPTQTWEQPYHQQPEQYSHPVAETPFYEDIYSANQPSYQGYQPRGAPRGNRGKRGSFQMRGPSAMVSRGGRTITKTSSTSNIEKPANEDECKMFVGGLDWELTADQIHEYFEMFGPVVEVKLKTDIYTGQSRGFAFLLFQTTESVDKVLLHKNHMIYGKRIDPKKAVAGDGAINTKKVFVGGIDPAMTEKDVAEAFAAYGKVMLVELPVDRSNNQRRSFGFVLFESEETVNELCLKSKVQLGTKMVDIRKMQPRDEATQASKSLMGPKKRGVTGGTSYGYNHQATHTPQGGTTYGYNQPQPSAYTEQNVYGQMYDYYDPSQQPAPMSEGLYGYDQTANAYGRGFRAGPSMGTRNVRGYHPYSR